MPLSSLKSCGSPLAPRIWASGNGVIPLSPHPRVEAPRLVAIVGPTATGKSQLALDLAKAFRGQIVSADSRQVYRYMDIGTAKPSEADRQEVLHHLHDLQDPDERFDLATFLNLATEAIDGALEQGQLPIVAGGSGQYVWALLEGWQLPVTPPNEELRATLESQDPDVLHRRLASIDPGAASRIHPNNLRRLVRALEVRQTDQLPASVDSPKDPRYHTLVIGLNMEREALYRRIDQRVDAMMEAGLLDEVHGLLDAGYDPALPSMQSTGYRELAQHLQGEIELSEAVQRVKYATHRLARRQYMWFRPTDPRICWLDASTNPYEEAARLVLRFLGNRAAYDTMPA